ncbi:hypothetical protein Tco_0062863, partial [Tanacetum coccineum]
MSGLEAVKRDGLEMASGHDFNEIEEVLQDDRLSAIISITQGTLLESADQKEIKKAEGEMQGTLDIKQKTIGGDLENRRNLRLWEQLGVASIEIQAYTQALKKVEAQYGNQIHEGVLSYEKEVLESVFDNRSSDVEDSHVNDRFAKVEGMHAISPPITGIYMPSKSDFGIDESKFTYGPKLSKTSESNDKTSDTASCEPISSVETPNSVPKLAVYEPTIVSKLKVWSDAPIIEEYESDNDDEYVIEPLK